ncbi:uncharacterized protein LOC110385045 isoform X1 [Bombyx mori]|uniref:TOG domain-containing protein n=1 Tax=Bombyx mori TaxID=7091 RepID=A0A8R2LW51_BOMMO|nr:uncharacterized protein LOC110385045 [Bombyx mori]XP_037867520.1 uncharacterized protein LOC110385045 [Bombyx mori]
MEDEVEDAIENLKQTESQKSVTISNVYSPDFSDSSSDRNISSDKNTYVIAIDESDDSEIFPLHGNQSVIDLKETQKTSSSKEIYNPSDGEYKSVSKSVQKYVFVAQESFTQTSKTIMELAKADANENYSCDNHETQTSLVSITENKTVKYKFEISNCKSNLNRYYNDEKYSRNTSSPYTKFMQNTLENVSSKLPESNYVKTNENLSSGSDKYFVDDETVSNEERYENTSNFEDSIGTDLDEDSLMERKRQTSDCNSGSDTSEIPKSVENDIEELYTKLTEHFEHNTHPAENNESNVKQTGHLTPLTEESTVQKDSIANSTSNYINSTNDDKDVLFTNNAGIKVKLLPECEYKEEFKLPPIKRDHMYLKKLFLSDYSCNINVTTENDTAKEVRESLIDRWEIRNKDLASGEGCVDNTRNDFTNRTPRNNCFQLPPIAGEVHEKPSINTESYSTHRHDRSPTNHCHAPISIKTKIEELKVSSRSSRRGISPSESRSISPGTISPDDSKLCEIAERGCEALCVEMLKRLRSSSWLQVIDTLEDIPKVLEKHWNNITEQRIADLLRQVSSHVESPRTQVARSACNTLAVILKNTNYTKKPDFYEAITLLLSKTGSYSGPVRRAANVALDEIVCSVNFTHAITALCIHGTGHKSGLVRCAACRLLVVACALAGGGRALLRSRPPTAACARKHTLRSLAALLDDKNTETRKYAERLYAILRPLPNFEAYYLNDVDIELATKQMKKYDQLVLCGGKKKR